MLGFPKAKRGDVLSHWYTFVEHFHASTKDFYAAIEKDLQKRKVPGLKMSRVTFAESGLMSAKRLYLRMERERLVFDICAAPFGTSFFFSMRFAELPAGTAWWRWIPLVLGSVWIWRIYEGLSRFSRIATLSPTFLLNILFVLALMLALWAIIRLLESHFRKESYYRQDTRLMYLEIVNAVVKQQVAQVTSAGGFHLLNIRQHSPILDELYKTTQVHIETVEAPPSSEPVAA